MNNSNNPEDGKAPEVPGPIAKRFYDGGDWLEARYWRRLWTILEGQPYTATAKQQKALRADPLYEFEALVENSAAYNHLIAQEPATKRRKRFKNSGRRKERELGKLVGVLPTGFAQRFPMRIDPRHKGAIQHRDVYGDVAADRTLRPQHLGMLAMLSGIYRSQKIYSERGMVTPDGRIVTSARKFYWTTVSRNDPGGAGLQQMHNAIDVLRLANFTAKTTTTLHKSRDLTIAGNPIANVWRLVDGDDGAPEWVAFDDERPTTIATENTLMFELADWYREKLEGVARDLVFFDMNIWRALPAFAARLFVYLQAKRRRMIGTRHGSFQGLHFYAAGPLLAQLGLTDSKRYVEVKKTLFAALLQIHRVVDRYEWVTPPTRALPGLPYFHFYIRLKDNQKASLRDNAPDDCLTKTWLSDERNERQLEAYFHAQTQSGLHPPPLRL